MQLLTPMFSSPRLGVAVSLGLVAALAVALMPRTAPSSAAVTGPAARRARELPPTNLDELRARGPAALDELLARYRWVIAGTGPDPAWEAAIDRVAGQRYASWSGLYWFTDRDRAKHEARRLHRPILALRMLGDLRDDLSCANSRLFRATLYANAEVSVFLRDNFVLYWSSERAVPVVTIDFHDGRKLVRTTTGNSAHYVLDDAGHVLDVLPGLYAPSVFVAELTRSLALARRVHDMTDPARSAAIVAYHAEAAAATSRLWDTLGTIPYRQGSRVLASASKLARAQAITFAKASTEVLDLVNIDLLRAGDVANDLAAWGAIGQQVWHITAPERSGVIGRAADDDGRPRSVVLDQRSRDLVTRLHNAGPMQRAGDAALATLIARLEHNIVADTAINELRLRLLIHNRIAGGSIDFVTLNAWIYEQVFATPASDPWLGLLTRTDFSGLPGDGVVMH